MQCHLIVLDATGAAYACQKPRYRTQAGGRIKETSCGGSRKEKADRVPRYQTDFCSSDLSMLLVLMLRVPQNCYGCLEGDFGMFFYFPALSVFRYHLFEPVSRILEGRGSDFFFSRVYP